MCRKARPQSRGFVLFDQNRFYFPKITVLEKCELAAM
jgi:hypothetical protein